MSTLDEKVQARGNGRSTTPEPVKPASGRRARQRPSAFAGGPGYRAAPITALLRWRWTWLAMAAWLGLVFGVLADGGNRDYQASAVLQLTGIQDSLRVEQVSRTLERTAKTPEVVAAAAARANLDVSRLSNGLSVTWQSETDLVLVRVSSPSAAEAVHGANAVAATVLEQAGRRAATRLATLRTEANRLLTTGSLNDPSAERSRRDQLGQVLAARQEEAVTDGGLVVLTQPAATAASTRLPRGVAAGLGAVGGCLLGALAAISVGLGRRRFRSVQELAMLAPDLVVRSTSQTGELAGRLLTGRGSTMAVLALPQAEPEAGRLAHSVAHFLRMHGWTATVLGRAPEDCVNPAVGDTAATTDPLWVLRHDVRQDLAGHLGTDAVVLSTPADDDTLTMIAGQSDLVVAVATRAGRTRLADLRAVVDAVLDAEPVVVVAQ